MNSCSWSRLSRLPITVPLLLSASFLVTFTDCVAVCEDVLFIYSAQIVGRHACRSKNGISDSSSLDTSLTLFVLWLGNHELLGSFFRIKTLDNKSSALFIWRTHSANWLTMHQQKRHTNTLINWCTGRETVCAHSRKAIFSILSVFYLYKYFLLVFSFFCEA